MRPWTADARARAFSTAVVLVLCVCNSGCGVLLQTAFGWNEEQKSRTRLPHAVRVDTPEGAEVTRIDPRGEATPLGPGPLVDEVGYEREEITKQPKVAGLIIGGLLSLAAGGALIAAARGSGDDDRCLDGEVCFDPGPTAATTGYIMGATVAILGGLTDLTVASIFAVAGGGTSGSRVIGDTSFRYTATLGGQTAEATVDVPERYRVELAPGATPAAPTLQAATPPLAVLAGPPVGAVIAVMDVEDVNADTDKALDLALVRNLGDQLRIFIAQTGARTVDRSAQQRALRDQITEMKSESYEACYDDACQIELGKALAASHILRSRVTRFGSRCVLNAELVDLRAEVTVKAASARGGCAAEGFLTMAEQVAQRVSASDRP